MPSVQSRLYAARKRRRNSINRRDEGTPHRSTCPTPFVASVAATTTKGHVIAHRSFWRIHGSVNERYDFRARLRFQVAAVSPCCSLVCKPCFICRAALKHDGDPCIEQTGSAAAAGPPCGPKRSLRTNPLNMFSRYSQLEGLRGAYHLRLILQEARIVVSTALAATHPARSPR